MFQTIGIVCKHDDARVPDTVRALVELLRGFGVTALMSGDSDGINKDYHGDLFLNGVEQADGSARQVWGGAHDLGNMAGSAIIDITDTGHDLDLRIKEDGAGVGTDIVLYHVNFNIVQVGGT